MTTQTTLTESLMTLINAGGGAWTGTAAEMLELRPNIASDATRLAKLLNSAAVELATAGIMLERGRDAGTGRRLLTLRRAASSVTPRLNRPAVGFWNCCVRKSAGELATQRTA